MPRLKYESGWAEKNSTALWQKPNCFLIEESFEDTLAEVELLIPYSEGGRLHELHEVAGDLERTERDDGVLVRAKVPAAELHRFEDLAVV